MIVWSSSYDHLRSPYLEIIFLFVIESWDCIWALSFENFKRRNTQRPNELLGLELSSASVARSLSRSVARSLGRLDARSLDRSTARSLDRSIVRSLDRSVARSIARTRDRSCGQNCLWGSNFELPICAIII